MKHVMIPVSAIQPNPHRDLAEASRRLQQLRPNTPSINRGLTTGCMPDWTPGQYVREHAERQRRTTTR
jgi:hypothetical protein